MPLIEKRYAEALAGLSEKTSSLEKVRVELGDLVKLFDTNPTFAGFFKNPQVSIDIKKNTIAEILTGKVDESFINFLKVLLDKGRLALLPHIYMEYCRIADKRKNVLNLTIITPFPLDASQLQKINDKYKKEYNASDVNSEVSINPSLIGGIQVKIGDRLYDDTLAGRLKSLKDILVQP